MQTFFKKMTSIAASAVIAVSSLGVFPAFSADDASTVTNVTIHFDYADTGATIAEDEDGNIPVLKDLQSKPVDSVRIPNIELEKKGYVFQGWTADGVYGYPPGFIYRTNGQDVVFKPVFMLKGDDTIYTCTYVVDYGDGAGPIENPKELRPVSAHPNEFIPVSLMGFQNDFKQSIGWTDGTHKFLQEQRLVMPEKNITLTPIWHNRHTLKYVAGDYNDIIGGDTAEFNVIESQSKDIADGSRFARKGYRIVHWHCEYDDKDYKFLSKFVMPDEDVTMTAVWVPIEYKIIFRTEIPSNDAIVVPGKTGDTIKVPEIEGTKEGYTFGGWKYDGKTYQSGDDFLIEGAAPGLGIALDPVWTKESEATTSTSTTTSTTTTSTSTTSTTSVTSTTSTAPVTETTPAIQVPENNYIKVEVVNEKGEPVKDVVIEYNHHITTTNSAGQKIFTGPIETMDTSKGNTVIHTKGTNEGDSSYLDSFKLVTDPEEHTAEPIPEADIKETHDKDKNIDVYTITIKNTDKVVYGDANCDGKINLSDAVLIMQTISNPSKYKLTDEGKKNADVAGNNDGVTNNDALAIQKYMLKLIPSLPEIK